MSYWGPCGIIYIISPPQWSSKVDASFLHFSDAEGEAESELPMVT